MFFKVKDVKPLKNYILQITFQNEAVKLYDVSLLFEKWTMFQALKNINGLFKQVKVEAGGYAVSWNDELDISCNELWENGYIK